ncbi:transporter substrate-binding domain-containing protein [Prauserella cavernicola]|uniref:Transporter substrate-binding domain-containing protein n=1 Tax=Prauserella cavernicola TaxID=2800127 RepID=A0A934QWP7_9PSEU|nr:transporter substrate-binding domain-containing protein [Prauserella cavernicola]MBK1787911.1 transporter substrate-binding domain-containing protein [Prauserella cavernicola]
MTRKHRLRSMLVVAISVLTVTVGCSSGGDDAGGSGPAQPDVQPDPEVENLVPPAVRERGVLRVAMMNNYKPYSYNENGEHVGMIPEMATAVAQVMGLEAENTAVDFSSILTGLQAQRYDIGMGEYFVREDRLQAADFVTEWSNHNSFIVDAAGDYQPETIADVCGRRIAILSGSSGVPSMETGVSRCAENGKEAPEVRTFSVMNDAVLALTSGRVDAVLTGREVGVSLEEDGAPVKTVGKVGGGPTATAVGRQSGNDGLPEAIAAAYRALIDNGVYESIHTKWKTDYGMITDPTVYRLGDTPPTYED